MSESVMLQDPGETLDYSFDWTDFLGDSADTVNGSVWAIDPAGPEVADQGSDANVTNATVAGVAFPGIYRLSNTVTTVQGRTAVRSIEIRAIAE